MDTGSIFAGFVISTIGFSLFLYGKKQTRLPQLVTGMILMAEPLIVHDAWWMAAIAVAVLAGMRVSLANES